MSITQVQTRYSAEGRKFRLPHEYTFGLQVQVELSTFRSPRDYGTFEEGSNTVLRWNELGLIPLDNWVSIRWQDGGVQKEKLAQFGGNEGDVIIEGISLANIEVTPLENPYLTLDRDYIKDDRNGWVYLQYDPRVQNDDVLRISYSVGGVSQERIEKLIDFTTPEIRLGNSPVWDLYIDGARHIPKDYRQGIVESGVGMHDVSYLYSSQSTYLNMYDFELQFESPEFNRTPYSSIWQAIESAQALAESIFQANEIDFPSIPLPREYQWLTNLLLPIARYFLLEQPYEIDIAKYQEAKDRLEKSIRRSARSRKGKVRKPKGVDFGYWI